MKLSPQSLAFSLYAGVAQSGLLESKICKKVFTSAYFCYKRYLEDPHKNLCCKYPLLFQGGHIIDAGANIGYTASVFANVVSAGFYVFAFEPEHNNFAILKQVIEENKLDNRVIPVASALGKTESKLTLWLNKKHPADHRILTDRFAKLVGENSDSHVVDVVSMDSFLAKSAPEQPVAFIKIDVQGYELLVCEGMQATLAHNDKIVVSFEYCPQTLQELGFEPQALIEFFQHRGFKLYSLDQKAKLTELVDDGIDMHLASKPYADLLASRYDLEMGRGV